MPLQNRVTPFGDIIFSAARGTMMGNRGGRMHDNHQRLGDRRWGSRRWICCELYFRGRQRQVMGDSYTELFFLDEVTALASGHRPCFECRNGDAKAFQAVFEGGGLGADAMDVVLHAERTGDRPLASVADLPDGAVWADGDEAFTRRANRVLRWAPENWIEANDMPNCQIRLLTPKSIIAALGNGYQPRWAGL
jgi:hypothetical protein